MSGSRAKQERQAARAVPLRVLNAESVLRSAEAVLRTDLDDHEMRSRVAQVAVGLCRAAFAQSKVVATLAKADLLPAASPNSRLVLEVALRLHWLEGLTDEDRSLAVDTMLAKDRDDTTKALDYLRGVGHTANFDPTEMNAFELRDVAKGALHQQVTRLRAAADSSETQPWSLYSMWLAETQSAHASGSLAGKYSPTYDNVHLSNGEPGPIDPDLEAHRLVQVHIVMTTCRILRSEGFPEEIADRIALAFFGE